ncbi:MAG: putative oxidoreductase [Propionibacteriaceae bacterium]|jgi:3-oxoacyl-[acyl-carrier protein] reductase|nr:putative oxidoreductase [Propionibacteriaceae bacterium]
MDLGLTGRTYVLTAASSGLGRAVATQLVEEGAKVVLVARRAVVLAEAVADLGADNAVALTADLTDPETAPAACRLALDTFGRLDGAVISVGGPPASKVQETTEELWRAAFDMVFLAGMRVSNAVLQAGTDSEMAIVWVLSTSVKSPLPNLAASNGLRPGLAVLIKQLADEVGASGARVVGLMPGRIETERVQHLDSLAEDPAAARAAAEAAIALRRSGKPEEFARVAAFVLSPAASYLTGCVIPVEGGSLRAL